MRQHAIGILAALASTICHAGSANLSWNESTTTGQNAPTGYNIYYGTAVGGPYATKHAAGLALSTTVPSLTAGVRYCFVATAFNAAGESGYSNEACATIPFPPASAAPAPATGLNASGTP